jgi:hypothetical protein
MAKSIKLKDLGRVLVEEVKSSSSLEFKATAFELFSQVIQKTPVRTGRARANWNITTGSPDNSVNSSTSTGSYPDLELEGFPSVFISNGLHYIPDLENGKSKQAPAGIFNPAIAAARANRRR